MIINSYFTGGGLLDIGIFNSGLSINKSYEIDAECCKIYRRNLGDHIQCVDISKKLVKDDLGCDVMLFTYPCTKYSTIGEIHGVRTGDELYLHALRHMAVASPEVFVLENVPGMKAFPIVMEAMTKLPQYYTTVFCPIKSETWLPQRRNRLIIFGSKKPFFWCEPAVKQPIKLKDILCKNPEVEIPESVYSRMKGKYRDLPIVSDPDKNDIAPTAVAHYAKDKSTRLLKDKNFPMGVRPYTVREYARLQGVPDWFEFNCSSNAAYRMIGNGVSVPVGEWVGKELQRYFN
jgi:DNA (cytosine-5)-methyltransferase 1